MNCKHCYSPNVEIRETRMVERSIKKSYAVKHVTVVILDCNNCGRVSQYEMIPLSDDEEIDDDYGHSNITSHGNFFPKEDS